MDQPKNTEEKSLGRANPLIVELKLQELIKFTQ